MKNFAVAIVVLWLGATLQYGLPYRVGIFAARPDFVLVAIGALSPLLSRPGATASSFLGGLLHGAIVGANMTHYVVSRTVAGFAYASTKSLRLEFHVLTVGLATALVTIVAGILYMFGAAPKSLGTFLLDTILSAVYNGVLAMPLYALLRFIIGAPVRNRI